MDGTKIFFFNSYRSVENAITDSNGETLAYFVSFSTVRSIGIGTRDTSAKIAERTPKKILKEIPFERETSENPVGEIGITEFSVGSGEKAHRLPEYRVRRSQESIEECGGVAWKKRGMRHAFLNVKLNGFFPF